MISLIKYYKRSTLNTQGNDLCKIVTEHLLSSNTVCYIDFNSINAVTPLFFQEFLFPLLLEFGTETVKIRIKLINLSQDHCLSYEQALATSSDFLDRKSSRLNPVFGDISDITFELLIKARELSRRDPLSAKLIFGLGSQMIKSISCMDIDQIRRIASAGIVCFEPRFTPEFASKQAALDIDEIDTFLNLIGTIDSKGLYESEYH